MLRRLSAALSALLLLLSAATVLLLVLAYWEQYVVQGAILRPQPGTAEWQSILDKQETVYQVESVRLGFMFTYFEGPTTAETVRRAGGDPVAMQSTFGRWRSRWRPQPIPPYVARLRSLGFESAVRVNGPGPKWGGFVVIPYWFVLVLLLLFPLWRWGKLRGRATAPYAGMTSSRPRTHAPDAGVESSDSAPTADDPQSP